MNLLFESSLPAILLGLVSGIVGVVGLLQTGRHIFLYVIAEAVGLTAILLCLSFFVTTEREKVQQIFHQVARHLKANDFSEIAPFIAPDATEMASIAQSQLSLVEVTDAAVTSGIDVDIKNGGEKPLAEANFIGRVVISNAKGDLIEFSKQPYVRKFTVFLRKDGDKWLMTDYRDQSVVGPN